MEYIYVHTNGSDLVLLPNGTYAVIGRDITFREYATGSAEARDEWNGSEAWEGFAKSAKEAAETLAAEGAEIVAHYDGTLIVDDDNRWVERCKFHNFAG